MMRTCDCGVEYSDLLFRTCPRCKYDIELAAPKKQRRTSGEVELAKREKVKTAVRRK